MNSMKKQTAVGQTQMLKINSRSIGIMWKTNTMQIADRTQMEHKEQADSRNMKTPATDTQKTYENISSPHRGK